VTAQQVPASSGLCGDSRALETAARQLRPTRLPDWATYRQLGYLFKLQAAENMLLAQF